MIQWINEATKQCMKGLVSRWINESINQWINEWSPWFICSLIHWFIDSYVRWLVDSLGHCFVASLVHWFIDSFVHRFSGSFTQLCTDSFMSFHWHLNHQLVVRWCTSHNFNRSWLLHLKIVPIGYWFLIVISYSWNFRPGACRALI